MGLGMGCNMGAPAPLHLLSGSLFISSCIGLAVLVSTVVSRAHVSACVSPEELLVQLRTNCRSERFSPSLTLPEHERSGLRRFLLIAAETEVEVDRSERFVP